MNEKLPNSGEIWNRKFEKGWSDGMPPESRLFEFIEKYKDEIGPNILDIGSGDGRHLIPLAKAGYKLTGFELTEEGIKKTKEKLDKEKTSAELVQGNFHKLPFSDSIYDTVISIQAMQHNNWRGAEAAFSEAARVLKPGGLFFLRVNSDKNAVQDNHKEIQDRGRTWERVVEGRLGVIHSFSFEELKELADKYNLEIEPGFVDEKKGLKMETDIKDEDYTITGDQHWLKEAILNLVDNAVKCTVTGKITVGLELKEKQVFFYVKDTGRGITPEDRKNLYTDLPAEALAQAGGGRGKDSLKYNPDSTGYGLSTVKLVVEAHKGKVWEDTEVGKGSTFYVKLPLTQK